MHQNTRDIGDSMKKWFSKSKSADKLMSEMLDSTSKGLESRIAVLEDEIKQIESELEAIKSKFSHSPGNTLKTNLKNKAIHLLKRKKVLEQHRDFALNQSLSIMQADISLDTVKGSIDTYKTMKGANKELSKQLKKVNMDKLEVIQFYLLFRIWPIQFEDVLARLIRHWNPLIMTVLMKRNFLMN